MFPKTLLVSIEQRLRYFDENVQHLIRILLAQHHPPPPGAVSLVPLDPRLPSVEVPCPANQETGYPNTSLEDGLLWAVPKNRRTREKRLTRKHAVEKRLPVKKLFMCSNCGGPYEAGRLCPVCYAQIKDVTQTLYEKVQDKFGLSPIEKDILAVYKGETPPRDTDRVIIEVPKPRPSFFTRNLRTPSTPANSDSTAVDVAPSTKVVS
ncbi:Ribosomal protein L32p [Trinorchestia longiramus]|nr:Ribosomal protein L32p [Trinorchestia longiramus]